MTTPIRGLGRGGARPGAGRPIGSTNHRARKRIIEAERAGAQMPLDFLLELMRDNELPLRERTFCAVAALPFCHPRLTVQKVSFLDPDTLSDEELLASIARLEAQIAATEAGEAGLQRLSPPDNPAPGAVLRRPGAASPPEWPVPQAAERATPPPAPAPPEGRRLRYDPIGKRMVSVLQ